MSLVARTVFSSIAAVVALLGTAVRADDGNALAEDEVDWLIARRNGQWEFVAKGPIGRVQKEYANQEVLRLVDGGSFVEVVSMPPVAAGEETFCAQRARRDARDLCSSAFLVCRPDPGTALISLALMASGAADVAADRRNRLACRVDVDGILRAALAVGMIRSILPVPDTSR